MEVKIELAVIETIDLLPIAQPTKVVIQTTIDRIHLRTIAPTEPLRLNNS